MSNENNAIVGEVEKENSWLDYVKTIAVAVAVAMVIRTFLFELYIVDGPSMTPTLHNNERLLVNKLVYYLQEPERGEVLIFKFPKDQTRDFIKRVIAVPGDTIEIRGGEVFVNGIIQDEPYILSKTRSDYPLSTVPEGTIFVMGDNRNNSEDSRFRDVGFVPYDLVQGRAEVIFWPLEDWGSIK